MNKKAIGVFDSGLGGLTVVKEIRKLLPNEDIVYLGDTARVPYGTRSRDTIVKFSFEDSLFLLERKVKCIVVACNTASALAGEELKNQLPIPVLDVIGPGVVGAVRLTKNKRVGVVGTRATILSHAHKILINRVRRDVKVFEKPVPLLVPFIEEGEVKGKLLSLLVKKSFSSFKAKNIDTLVLGCTHYPIVEGLIAKELKGVFLVNPGVELTRSLKKFLYKNDMQSSGKRLGRLSFYVTDLTPRFTKVAEMFLGEKIEDRVYKADLSLNQDIGESQNAKI